MKLTKINQTTFILECGEDGGMMTIGQLKEFLFEELDMSRPDIKWLLYNLKVNKSINI